MELLGRSAQLGRLRHALDQRRASLVRVTGARGVGKSALVSRCLGDYDHAVLRARPLTDPALRAQLRDVLLQGDATRADERPEWGDPPQWGELFAAVRRRAARGARPFVLVLDDVHRLAEARSRYRRALAGLIESARSEGRAVHVVLVGPRAAMPEEADFEPPTSETIDLRPLPLRPASALLPGSRPDDLLRAYAVFGGIPRVLRALDRDAALGTNLRRVLLAEQGALADAGGIWVERDVQTPARYYSILATLSAGEADWSTVHAGVPDLTRSGQVAPYMRRLEELGLVRTRRSLDAPPNARARRYALADPFLATWARFSLLAPPRGGAESADAYSTIVRPALDDHMARAFPAICRQHMEHAADETLGSSTRENGSLWGPSYDVPVAGIVTSGFAYYGSCAWRLSDGTRTPLDHLDRQLREIRYGFGREHRIRLVFTGRTPPPWLSREVARRHDARLVDPSALVGDR